MKLILEKNNGYKWLSIDNFSFKGYFQFDSDPEKRVYRAVSAINELKNRVCGYDDFLKILTQIDGVYSIVAQFEDEVYAAVDVSRSLPIFYSRNGGVISDSAEAIREYLSIDKENVNINNYIELLNNDFLFGDNTVYSDIKQLDLGQALRIKGNQINLDYYFYHLNDVETSISEESAISKLLKASYDDFRALKNAIAGRPVVLSLSGGYDSRFVATMLKEVGVNDVSCYTYGKSDSFEVIQSKKNADALGFRWICIEHTDEEMRRANDKVGQEYMDSYTTHDFTAYMQNFPAVRKLHEIGWIKPNSVFITGLCGDMPTGEYIEKEISGKEYSVETAIEKLYQLLISPRYDLPDQFKKAWKTNMGKYLGSLPIKIKDYQSWVTATDCIYTMSVHPHWFMNMNAVHSFFGYEWLLPYWNRNLLKAWYAIPAKMRVDQKLYEKFLLDNLCAKYGINTRKYIAGYSRSNIIRALMYKIGAMVVWIFFHLGMPFKNKYDYNNFAPFDFSVYKDLKCKDTVIWKKAGTMHLVNQRCLQKRYGVDIMKKALRAIKGK